LRGTVTVGPEFFHPLPTPEMIAWSTRATPLHATGTRKNLAVALKAFWALATKWRLSPAEQGNLLAVSRRTRARWRAKPPVPDAAVLDRLRLIFLTYECLEAAFAPIHGADSSVVMWYVHLLGTAHNPDAPKQSVLDALSERSVLGMLCNYGRVAARFKPQAIETQNPFPLARGGPPRGKRSSRSRESRCMNAGRYCRAIRQD
jgi:hypothetical protein